MQKYLDLISQLLEEQETPCFLPGIGILKFKEEAAKEDQANGQLSPPHTFVILEKTEKPALPYHSIVQEIKKTFNLSEEAAQAEWSKTIEYIKKQLAEGNEIVFSGIGKLIVTDQQGLKFVESPEKYTLYPTVSYPVPELSETPSGSVENPYLEEPSGKKNWGWFVALGVIILAGAGFFLYKYKDTLWTDTKQSEKTSPVPAMESHTNQAPSDSVERHNETAPVTPGKTTPDSIHFAVIYAVYPTKKIAERHYKQMHSWGHDVSIYPADSSHYQLGYTYYELPVDTTKRLNEIKALYGGNPFLIYLKK